ncbi:Glutathione S-transferase [Theobroma cacao]|uniref:Thioredoxin family protein isoform 1 n=1 Tax=Theobroma cacao TaxID=3641 RepID=A0A061ETW7_THECC|nr:Thioredoxin family protein isoform 1 [Theobroma cacao]WRX25561.1 Glutathione S-transferase [Theobroma cacao]
MVGVLNIPKLPLFSPLSLRKPSRPFISVKASSESSDSQASPASTSTKEEQKPSFASSSTATTFAPPPNFKPPEPKRFTVRPDKTWDILGASLALFFRLGTGVFVSGYSASFVSENEIPPGQYCLEVGGSRVKETSKIGPRPEKPIEIYEFEGISCFISDEEKIDSVCFLFLPLEIMDNGGLHTTPVVHFVEREIVAVLDLDVLFYPCPKNGPNFRPKVTQMGGKQQFPYMVDPNTGVAMYESDEIIKYLVGKYGDGSVPFMLSLGLLTTLTAGFAMIGRMGKGSSYTPSKLPPKPLEIWSYEGSPFCKIVREVLVELELPHFQRSCARGSPKRQILYEKAGHFQVPYLEDPNTGVQMFESAEIAEYLRATYAQ